MTQGFFHALNALVESCPDRYPGLQATIEKSFSQAEMDLLCDLDAALTILATEVYGLRPEVESFHEHGEDHIVVFKPGFYNRNEHEPRLQDFFLACAKIRNKHALVIDAGVTRDGDAFLSFDDTSDIYGLICGLCETKRFEKAILEGKFIVPINAFEALFDALSAGFFPEWQHEELGLKTPPDLPSPRFH